jgi:Flp pilus assembly protein TadG
MRPGRGRRGAYGPLFALVLVGLLSMGALAIDTAHLGQCRTEARAIADGAARGGLVVLRSTGDTGDADAAIAALVAAGDVCGAAPDSPTVTWGRWDDTDATPTFAAGATPPNAVRVSVARTGANSVDTFLAGLMGFAQTEVRVSAVAATRSVHALFVVDQQDGWTEAGMLQAQAAVQSAFARVADAASPADAVGVIGTSGPYAWELTPLTGIGTALGRAAVEADLAVLSLASFAGSQTSTTDGIDCSVFGSPNVDDFATDSCYPAMPRRYSDEGGVDPAVALELAWAEHTAAQGTIPVQHRVVVLLTAHDPTAVLSGAGTERAADSYSEPFTELVDTIPIDAVTIAADAETQATALWDDLRAHVWVVSVATTDPVYDDLPRGDGWHAAASTASELEPLMRSIVSAWPIAVVE